MRSYRIIDFASVPEGQIFRHDGAIYRKWENGMGVLILRAMRRKQSDDHLRRFTADEQVQLVQWATEW